MSDAAQLRTIVNDVMDDFARYGPDGEGAGFQDPYSEAVVRFFNDIYSIPADQLPWKQSKNAVLKDWSEVVALVKKRRSDRESM